MEITTDFILSLGFKEVPKEISKHPNHFYLPIMNGALYLRPSYLDGYYWGICENEFDINNPIEFDAVQPIKIEGKLHLLVNTLKELS